MKGAAVGGVVALCLSAVGLIAVAGVDLAIAIVRRDSGGLAVAAVLTACGGATLVHVARCAWASGGRLHGAECGAAATEFILTIPVILLLIMGTIQLALLNMAKSVAEYGAFAAAREAALTIGESYPGEPPGCICDYSERTQSVGYTSGSKIAHVRRIGALPMVAVAPNDPLAEIFGDRPASVARALGETPRERAIQRRSIDSVDPYDPDPLRGLGDRALYALAATSVELIDVDSGRHSTQGRCDGAGIGYYDECHRYGRMSEVSVALRFVFPLRVPLVSRIFRSTLPERLSGVAVNVFALRGDYTIVAGRATVLAEGVD